ncbi:uncharacterized protein LOC119182975 [Rhipicephalus microplus]|uniref:uncharacterized protein LOC119182975 n=1 Tax=Rhipicephalus microplus TaxID=6941 RepID=UPI003F6B2A9C
MTANPFVFIVQLVATLLLIPAECDVLGWQAAINALQPAILLPVNVSTAHAHLSDIWTTPPSSTAVGALAGLDGGATALQAIHWSIKPDRNHPDAIGHGSITGMTANPFVFIVQLVATLLLIPAECDVLGWQAAINALQPAILLPVNLSTAHAHLSDIWTTPPSSTAVGALAGLDEGATALQASHWSIKPARDHPDAIGHGSITGMTANPFVFIVQDGQRPSFARKPTSLEVLLNSLVSGEWFSSAKNRCSLADPKRTGYCDKDFHCVCITAPSGHGS